MKNLPKSINFMRHAEAVNPALVSCDSERCLTSRGVADVEVMAKFYKAEFPEPDVIISSTSTRAIETAKILSEDKEIVVDSRLLESGWGPGYEYRGGESKERVEQRLCSFGKDICNEWDQKTRLS